MKTKFPYSAICYLFLLFALCSSASALYGANQTTTYADMVTNTNDGSEAMYCQIFNATATSDTYINFSFYEKTKGGGAITYSNFTFNAMYNLSHCNPYNVLSKTRNLVGTDYNNSAINSYVMLNYTSMVAGTRYCLCYMDATAANYMQFGGSIAGNPYPNGTFGYTPDIKASPVKWYLEGNNDIYFVIQYETASGGGGANSSPPVITLNSPAANYHNNVNLSVNFSTDKNNASCVLYVQNVSNSTRTGLNATTTYLINATGMYDAIFSWFLSCNDTYGNNSNTSPRNYYVDTYVPIEFNITSPKSDNTSAGFTPLVMDLWADDTYLFAYNLSAINASGGVVYNDSGSNITPPHYHLTQTINFTKNGNYTIQRCWADSHTALAWQDYALVSYDALNNKINYDFEKTHISVSLISTTNRNAVKSITTSRLFDRYVFSYDLSAVGDKNDIEQEYIFRVLANEKIYFPKSSYPSHAVIGRYWVDFDIPGTKAEIIRTGENYYDVRVMSKSGKLLSQSLGGLNEICYASTYNYTIAPPYAPVISVPVNASYDADINIQYSASVSPSGYDISYYVIELLNTDRTLNETIKANNSVNLSYDWNCSEKNESNYTMRITAYDTNGLSNASYSLNFSVYHGAWHVAPYYLDFKNNASYYAGENDEIKFDIKMFDNIALANYTFYVSLDGSGSEYNRSNLSGMAENVSILYLSHLLPQGTDVCGYFRIYDIHGNYNDTSSSCYRVYKTPLFSNGLYLMGFLFIICLFLFYAEYINSSLVKFVAATLVLGFGLLIWEINHLFAIGLCGISLLLMLRAFWWKR